MQNKYRKHSRIRPSSPRYSGWKEPGSRERRFWVPLSLTLHCITLLFRQEQRPESPMLIKFWQLFPLSPYKWTCMSCIHTESNSIGFILCLCSSILSSVKTGAYFARQDEINGGRKVPCGRATHSNRGLEELLESSEPALEEQLGDRTIRSQHLLTSYSLGT